MAKAKNNIGITDDSRIHSAIRYYEEEHDSRRAMIAYYYLGFAQYCEERYSEAIVNYYKAKTIAEELGEWHWVGLGSRGLSDIYNVSQNKEEELAYAKQEYDYFQKSGRQPYLNYAMLDLGRALYNHDEYDSALCLMRQLTDSAQIARDTVLLMSAYKVEASNLILKNEYEKAKELLAEIIDIGYGDSQDSIQYWASLIFSERRSEADKFAEQLLEPNTSWHYVLKYMVFKHDGNYSEALRELEAVDSIREELVIKAMSNNVNGALVDFVEMDRKLATSELKAYHFRFWLLLVLIVFIGCIITWWLIRLFRRINYERDSKIAFAEELQEALAESVGKYNKLTEVLEKEKTIQSRLSYRLEEERIKREELIKNLREEEEHYDSLLKELSEERLGQKVLLNDLEEEKVQRQLLINSLVKEREVRQQHRGIIKTLLANQFQYLEEVIQTLQMSKDSKTARRRIADYMTEIINELSNNGNKIKELENKIDTTYDSLMANFREDLPMLKDIDYRLFLFSVIGFSIPSITLLLKAEKVEDIYNRKRHLKDKIKRLEKTKAEKYLSYIR